MLKTVVVGVLLMLGTNIGVEAQSAEKILAEVSERYQQLDGFKATFEYTYSTDTDGVVQSSTGEVTVKGDKYRLVLDDQEIYNDGNTVWTYIKSSRYEEVTINSVEQDSEELTPSNVYNIYKRGYDSKLLGEKNIDGKEAYEILLTSEKKSNQFKEIRLLVDKNSKDLVAWEIADDAGGKFQYKFKEVNKNQRIQDDYFVFNTSEHKNIEIIDLR